jgi:hypothetical protein
MIWCLKFHDEPRLARSFVRGIAGLSITHILCGEEEAEMDIGEA